MTKRSRASAFLPWIVPTCLLGAWFWVCRAGIVPTYLLPDPMDIGRSAWVYLFGEVGSAPYAGRFVTDLSASTGRVAMGFAAAVVFGIPMGVVSGRVPIVRSLLGTTVNGLRSVPGISWLPLAMVWFGVGMKTTVFLVALASFFPVYVNTAIGAGNVDFILYQVGATMGVGRIRGVFDILLPAAMPQIMSGLRLGLGTSWAYLVLGELTGVPFGLGALIMDARMMGRIDMIIVGIVVIAAMGRLSDLLLSSAMRFFFRSARRMA